MDFLLSHPSQQLDQQLLHVPVRAKEVGFRLLGGCPVAHWGYMVRIGLRLEELVTCLDHKHQVAMAFDHNHRTQVTALYRSFELVHTLVVLPVLCLHLLSSLLLHQLRQLPSCHHSFLLGAALCRVLPDRCNHLFVDHSLLWVH